MPLSATSTAALPLRKELQGRGGGLARQALSLPDAALVRVLVLMDVGLSADALCMWPRPAWLVELVGPVDMTSELLDPRDVASPGW